MQLRASTSWGNAACLLALSAGASPLDAAAVSCLTKANCELFKVCCNFLLCAGTPTPAAAPAVAAAPAAPAAGSPTKKVPVDPLDELFAAPATQPAAAPDFSSFAPAAAPTPYAAAPMQQGYSPMPNVGSTGLPMQGSVGMAPAAGHAGPYGALGIHAGPMASVGSAGFTSVGSWGPGALNPAASVSSTGPFDSHAAAAGGGGLGFEDAAFAPVDDWRVMGDVQQWHRALLTKEKVSRDCQQGAHLQAACRNVSPICRELRRFAVTHVWF